MPFSLAPFHALTRPLGGLLAALVLMLAAPLHAQSTHPVEIVITGVSGDLREALRGSLTLQRELGHPLLGDLRIKRLHRRATDELRAAMRPFGYYQAEVESALSQDADGTWRAVYRISPGEPVRVAHVDLRIEGAGAEDPRLVQWQREFPLAPGDILLHRIYDGARDQLLQVARDRGFLEGELITHEVRVRVAEASADVVLHFRTGPRYRFGEVSFSTLPLRDSFLQRFPVFRAGDYYDAEKVFRLHRDLTDSDYFERVEVVPRVDAAEDRRVPVEVSLEMRKRDRYTMGLGYGTDTGPRLTLGMERRFANARGHRFGGDVLISEVRSSGMLSYRIPLDRPSTDFLGFNGGREHEETDTFTRDTDIIGISLTHLLDSAWFRTVSLNFQEEHFEVGDQVESSSMLYPTLGFQRVEADDRLFTQRGWRVIAQARAASEDLASTTTMVQGRLAAKAVRRMLGGRTIGRFDVAATYVTDFAQLPVSMRFFAGGDQSVRGFAYQELGPENADGEVTGGRHLLVWSVEHDRYFSERWGAAVFTDLGNAFDSFSDYELHQGVGAGLRWRLPFGLIRLDLASAVSEDGEPWRLHLTLGPDL